MSNYNIQLQFNNENLIYILDSFNELPYSDYSKNEDNIVTGMLNSYTNSVIETIGGCAFYYCRSLTSASLPRATTIGNSAFGRCDKLTSVSLPMATTIGNYAFYNCRSLTSVSLPVCTDIGDYAFGYCYSLTSVSLPMATTIGNSAFGRCDKLTSVSLQMATTIGNYAFYNCYNLKSLYLTGSSLCKLSNSNAFTSTPIGGHSTSDGTYGSIYVPMSLLASYKSATNWTYFSSRFIGIEISG